MSKQKILIRPILKTIDKIKTKYRILKILKYYFLAQGLAIFLFIGFYYSLQLVNVFPHSKPISVLRNEAKNSASMRENKKIYVPQLIDAYTDAINCEKKETTVCFKNFYSNVQWLEKHKNQWVNKGMAQNADPQIIQHPQRYISRLEYTSGLPLTPMNINYLKKTDQRIKKTREQAFLNTLYNSSFFMTLSIFLFIIFQMILHKNRKNVEKIEKDIEQYLEDDNRPEMKILLIKLKGLQETF